ncbi:cilia- and flagella-associated protein 95 isoform X5 [Hyla sarda]|uniref:cilia- and flagella-associated protein 95 isoform X5 n=1 Tax=Hyla sarda TaxID=327740 RepID=UPI0024C46E29|nr:cilia- and flagella-associated protein 95 isoform X5 [Hyla sarda]
MYVVGDRRDMLETKGSLYLRSGHMHYDKPTKVSGWHQSREAEPKDYDVSEAPLGKKNLCYSTYRRLGNISNEDWNTTTEQQLSQVHLKGDYEVRDVHKKMVNEDNLDTLNLKRETGLPDSGFGAVLPHHSKDYNKMHLDTTYGVDYMAPLQYTSSLVKDPEVSDYCSAFKKCHSQFTDTADYRRPGRNTWQDESGIYANSGMRQRLFKPSCPITPHL